MFGPLLSENLSPRPFKKPILVTLNCVTGIGVNAFALRLNTVIKKFLI